MGILAGIVTILGTIIGVTIALIQHFERRPTMVNITLISAPGPRVPPPHRLTDDELRDLERRWHEARGRP